MKALIKTVLVTCLMLGGAAATQTASAGDLVIRVGTGGGYHGMHYDGHRAMPRVAHPRVAYVRPAPPRVVYVRPAPPRVVHVRPAPPRYVRPMPPRYVRPMPPRWGGHHGHHGRHHHHNLSRPD